MATAPRSTRAPSRRARLGATYLGNGRGDFLVWAPETERVEVVIEAEDGATVLLAPLDRGYHRGTADGVAPGTRYRYRLDGGDPLPDPASRAQPDGVHGPSAVVDLGFRWNDPGWTGLGLEELVLYEIHVGAFTPEGTLDAIVPRLGELAELGVTGLELMPVSPFPGARNWGYDGVFPFAVHEAYGGPAALARLVDAAHGHGIAVVLDVVYNHLGPEGNVLGRYGPYFTDRYTTPWGDALNFDGAGSDEVRRYFIESALAWVHDFHVDALRLDAVHAILDTRARPFLDELGWAVHVEGDAAERRVLLIPESDDNDPRLVERRELGGLGLDAVWCDDFHHALHAALTGEQHGYYADFGALECLEWAYDQGFVYAGQRSVYRHRRHGRSSEGIPAERFVVFAQNHDQVGNRAGSERLTALVDAESAKLAAAATILSPFVPLLFMGEEHGETAPFPYFTDHSDPDLAEAVRKGRAAEFAAFEWDGEVPDPQNPATFESARIDWGSRTGSGSERLDLYRELLRLRREVPALARLSKSNLHSSASEEDEVLFLHRWEPHGSGETVLVLHFGREPAERRLAVDPGTWQVALDTADPRWGGPGSRLGSEVEAGESGVTLPLAARSAVLLSR